MTLALLFLGEFTALANLLLGSHSLSPLSNKGKLGQILLICLVAPVCEEFFFSGLLQTHLIDRVKGGEKLFRFHFSYGLILTALIFGAVHLSNIFLFDLSVINGIINRCWQCFLVLFWGMSTKKLIAS